MIHLNVNWLAVVVATFASMALGMGWYMSLGKQWMAALDKTEEDIKAGSSTTPFIWAAAAQFVMAYFLAVLSPLLTSGGIYSGILTGVHMWLGFIVTGMIINHRYQDQKWSLTLIDGGYLLGVMIVQGAVIGIFS